MEENSKKYSFSAKNYIKNSLIRYIIIFILITIPFTLLAKAVNGNLPYTFAFIGGFTALVEIGMILNRSIAYKKGYVEIKPTFIRYFNVKADGYNDEMRTEKVFLSEDYIITDIDSIEIINNRIHIKGIINMTKEKFINGEIKKRETKVLTTCTINPYYDNWDELKNNILNKKNNQ